MKYVVDRIEENLVVLINESNKEVTIKKREELPKVMPGDYIYYENGEYYVDEYEREKRLKNIRAELREVWDPDNEEE